MQQFCIVIDSRDVRELFALLTDNPEKGVQPTMLPKKWTLIQVSPMGRRKDLQSGLRLASMMENRFHRHGLLKPQVQGKVCEQTGLSRVVVSQELVSATGFSF